MTIYIFIIIYSLSREHTYVFVLAVDFYVYLYYNKWRSYVSRYNNIFVLVSIWLRRKFRFTISSLYVKFVHRFYDHRKSYRLPNFQAILNITSLSPVFLYIYSPHITSDKFNWSLWKWFHGILDKHQFEILPFCPYSRMNIANCIQILFMQCMLDIWTQNTSYVNKILIRLQPEQYQIQTFGKT